MKRVAAVDRACQRCRQKRAKCDGRHPCQRCQAAAESCEYRDSKFVSKRQLRAQIENLQRDKQSSKGMASGSVPAKGIITTSRKYEEAYTPASSSTNPSANTDQDSNTSQPFDELLSWKLCRPQSAQPIYKVEDLAGVAASTPKHWTIDSTIDSWTETGWPIAHILDLFDVIITWDYVPFGLLDTKLFLEDYQAKSTRYCSTALVHAVLALSTLLLNGHEDDVHGVPFRKIGGRGLFQIAESVTSAESVHQMTLADIQALGFMSVYQLRCGREPAAHLLSDIMLKQINTLYDQGPSSFAQGGDDKAYARVLFTTHRGATSLSRILSLTTGKFFHMPLEAFGENRMTFQCFPEKSVWKPSKDATSDATLPLQSHDAQAVIELLFQLTEWVFALNVANLSSPDASEAVRAFYIRSLDWYEEVLSILKQEINRNPLLLFTHIYYHFSLLCAFRPLMTHSLASQTELEVIAVCTQAAQSIMSLVHSYDDLFTLQRVPTLLPYIVLATALFALALEETDLEISLTQRHLLQEQVPMMTQIQTGQQEFGPTSRQSDASPFTKVSIVQLARSKLRKMGSSHALASVAESKLR